MKNKTVWITGASAGIGAALAKEFSRKGANVILSARRKSALEQVAAQCSGEGEKHIFPLDISDFNAIEKTAAEVLKKVGKVDILVNNAGVSQRSLVKDTLFEVDEKIMKINFLGAVKITKAVLPAMLKGGGGNIVVISSVMGKYASPLRSAYAASKHALHGYFDALRAEVHDDNIAVTVICPGFVRTDVSKNALTGDGSAQNKMDEAAAAGMDPNRLAKNIVRAMEKGKHEVYYGGKEVFAIYLKRFFPRLLNRIIRKVKVT